MSVVSSESVAGDGNKLMFAPFSSQVSTTFWSKFDQVKLDVLQLKDDPVAIWGFYGPNDISNVNPILTVDNASFERDTKPHFGSVKAPGLLVTTKSLQAFKDLNYNDVMRSTGSTLFKDLFTEDGLQRVAEDPSVLSSFLILSFPDFKKFKFLFWFGFPAITLSSHEITLAKKVQKASEVWSNIAEVQAAIKRSNDLVSKGFFILKNEGKNEDIQVKGLQDLPDKELENFYFGFLDTSTVDDTPSWVLRNYLAFLILKLKISAPTVLKIFAYRPGRLSGDNSLIFHVSVVVATNDLSLSSVKFIGWERNEKGGFGPKHVDVQQSLDPKKLAENSVDFNLKLMKWRLFPDFDLEMMHQTKCLLLGAGTLGCNVARCLMGWGVRNITFADNGHVSYSNPARQSLYVFEDCDNGGKEKAKAAADNLRKIFPGINSSYEKLMIPMPGHPTSPGTIEQTRQDYEKLVSLIEQTDVVFLLMDTRESRWLPTLLGMKLGKIVINAALGFDSYVVMRHGVYDSNKQDRRRLGCYFCTDVVAPGDSTKDRTLDQQCTVTRPGVSMIASAFAVELLAAVLHHPDKGLAIPDPSQLGPLGMIPHTIRGFLGTGEQISPSFQSFDKCTACSDKVLAELEQRGFDFIVDVLNNSGDYLERITGLDKLKDDNDLCDGIIELSDDDDAGSTT